MPSDTLREKAIALRLDGGTFHTIQQALGLTIPKSTLSTWFRPLHLSAETEQKRTKHTQRLNAYARERSRLAKHRMAREEDIHLEKDNEYLKKMLYEPNTAKLMLATLYACEGGKNRKNSRVCFGNSDPGLLALFLRLMRTCYALDERKFRCTIQTREDLASDNPEGYWSRITGVPLSQFYKTRIDARSDGKPSIKKEYRGVCVVDYFSAHLLKELLAIGRVITKGR